MANPLSIVPSVAFMTLFILSLRNIPVSSASFHPHQKFGTSLLSRSAPSLSVKNRFSQSTNAASSRRATAISTGSHNSLVNACGRSCFVHNLSQRFSTIRKMTTSSQEGLSDIGQSTKGGNTKNNSDDDGNGDSSISNWKKRIDISIAKSRKIRGSNYVQISTINYETMEPRCRTVVFRGFLKGVPLGAVEDVLNNGRVEVDGVNVEGDTGGETKESYNCVMKMITDVRSNKIQELEMFHEMKSGEGKDSNTVEMVWWFPKSSEQYRISGRLQFIGSNGPLFSYTDNDVKDDDDDNTTDRNNCYFMAERKQQWGNLSDMAREQFFWEKPGIPYSSSSADGVESYAGVPPGGRDDDGKLLPPPDSFLIMLLYPSKIDYLRLTDNYRQIDEWDWGGDGCSGRHWKSMRVNP